MALLRYIDDAGRLQTKTLDSEQFVIGRAPTCELTIEDDTLSREHVKIELERGGRYRIRDLGSRNKTHVNGELITETLLSAGDVIRAGSRIFEFLDDATAVEKFDLEFLTPDASQPEHSEWTKIKAPLALSTAQLEQLALLAGELALTARPEDIAHIVMGQLILDLRAERGFIALRGEGKTDLRPLAHRALRRSAAGSMMPVSQSFVFAPLLQGVAGRYPQSTGQLNTKLGFSVTAVVAPLIYHGDIVGVVYVDRPTSKKPFNTAAVQYLLAAGTHLGALLGDASRRLTRTTSRESAAWMSTLRRAQASLTSAVEKSDTFDAAVKTFPGRARCGDFADVIHLDEHRCALLVIDGGGHGISGIAQASAIRGAVHAVLAVSEDAAMDPVEMFSALNRLIASTQARQILPCTYVGIDVTAGKLTYIAAGTPPPLVMVAPGRLVTMDQPSLVLGVDGDYVYEATRVDLPEVFRVVVHTDGLSEATNASGEAVTDHNLHDALLEREAFASAGEVIARLARVFTQHLAGAQPDDDALILVVGRG